MFTINSEIFICILVSSWVVTRPGMKEMEMREMEMGNRNEEMEMKKWRNGGNKSEAWRITLSSLWRYRRTG